jgi:hypothetical protein
MVRVGYTRSSNWIPNNTADAVDKIPTINDERRPQEVKIPRPKMQKKFFDRLFKDRVIADLKRMELVKKGKSDKIKQEMKEVRSQPRVLSPDEQKIKQRVSIKSVKKKKKEIVSPSKKPVSPTNQHVY